MVFSSDDEEIEKEKKQNEKEEKRSEIQKSDAIGNIQTEGKKEAKQELTYFRPQESQDGLWV